MSTAKASNEYLWQMIWKDGFLVLRVLALRTRIANSKNSLTLFQQRCKVLCDRVKRLKARIVSELSQKKELEKDDENSEFDPDEEQE